MVTEIQITNQNRKRALMVVDVQAGFLNDQNRWIIPNIQKVVQNGKYNLIIESIFHAEAGSLWDRQTNWTFPLQPTVPEIKNLFNQDSVLITKETKSVFKGDKDLFQILKDKNIEEVHIVGLDTNDCVFATAQESFDLGFFTYVIEECTESSQSSELRDCALKILRELNMTTNLIK
ncbi:MAG: isochorismatase family protein [Candidatus Paceibacterota bacterium]